MLADNQTTIDPFSHFMTIASHKCELEVISDSQC